MKPEARWRVAITIAGLSLLLIIGDPLHSKSKTSAPPSSPATSSSALPLATASPKAEDPRKSAFLQSIEKWKDLPQENDLPSLELSPEERLWIQDLYLRTPREQLNWRGTLLFFFSRNAEISADLDFLQEVLREPPCLSLNDCTKSTEGDEAGSSPTTLDYPRKVVRYQLEQKRKALPSTDPFRQRIDVLLRY